MMKWILPGVVAVVALIAGWRFVNSPLSEAPWQHRSCVISEMEVTTECGRMGGSFANGVCSLMADRACVSKPGSVRFYRLGNGQSNWQQEELVGVMQCDGVSVENPCAEE